MTVVEFIYKITYVSKTFHLGSPSYCFSTLALCTRKKLIFLQKFPVLFLNFPLFMYTLQLGQTPSVEKCSWILLFAPLVCDFLTLCFYTRCWVQFWCLFFPSTNPFWVPRLPTTTHFLGDDNILDNILRSFDIVAMVYVSSFILH